MLALLHQKNSTGQLADSLAGFVAASASMLQHDASISCSCHAACRSASQSFADGQAKKCGEADLWEEEVGHLADASCRCMAQGLFTDALNHIICEPHN